MYDQIDSALVSLQIIKFIIHETGTYNPMYSRPYDLRLTGGDVNNIVNRVVEFGSDKITGNLLAGITSPVLRPISEPEALINIPNGWDNKRLRFMIEIRCVFSIGADVTYYLQGYTSHSGIMVNSYNNALIDEQMDFIVNSVIGVNNVMLLTPHGYTPNQQIREKFQMIQDDGWSSYQEPNNKYVMRPQDIFSVLQTEHLNIGGNNLELRNSITDTAFKSSRKNNIPTSYLTEIINAYIKGRDSSPFDLTGGTDILTSAKSNVVESPLFENPVIRQLSLLQDHSLPTNKCKISTLRKLDPNVENVLVYIVQGKEAIKISHNVGETSYWNSTSSETIMATMLGHAIPTLMLECMFSVIHFSSHNMTHNGLPETLIGFNRSIMSIDVTPFLNLFKHRVDTEILKDITFDYQEIYMLDVKADMCGEVRISIGLHGDPVIDYVIPAFCDHSFVPVVTANREHISEMAGSLQQLLNITSEELIGNTKTVTNVKPTQFINYDLI
jgi:hypothetical protein